MMASCSSQEIDLAEINLPYSGNDLINKYQTEKQSATFENLSLYISMDPRLLVFNDIDLNGQVSEKHESQNRLEFYVEENEVVIPFFRVNVFTSQESEKLYRTLLARLGDPVFYSKNNDFFYGAWEKNNITYLYEYNFTGSIGGVKSDTGSLYILDNTNAKLTEYYYSSGFQYFGDFVEMREKKNNPDYTYEEFAEDEADDWNEVYLKKLKTNLPL
ncbi:hypothetical protein DN748_00400 [Sinomicrobium soli]|nr:hypothetical protein DN748_00400 [Sinomicrobium sp. N-1-3-6]